MSIDRVRNVHKIIQQQLQTGDELSDDLPAESDGRVTFEIRTTSPERARALTVACRGALGTIGHDIEPARCVSPGDRSQWSLTITVEVGGTRAL